MTATATPDLRQQANRPEGASAGEMAINDAKQMTINDAKQITTNDHECHEANDHE